MYRFNSYRRASKPDHVHITLMRLNWYQQKIYEIDEIS
jgi:hypothetical protein